MTDVTMTSFLSGVHTRQDVFNFVYKKLMEQGQGSVNLEADDGAGMCYYRGLEDCKCAVGWLIPDEEYKPEMDKAVAGEDYGTSVVGIVKKFYSDFADKKGALTFLRDLQAVHDDASYSMSSFPVLFSKGMIQFARQHGLDSSISTR